MSDAPAAAAPATSAPVAVTVAVTNADESRPRRRSYSKSLLLLSAVVCYVGCWWISGRLGITRERGFDGALLLGGGAAVMRVIVTGVLVLAAVQIGTVIAGRIRPDAGLFAAACGLLAVSNRGRPVFAVLHDTNGSRGTYALLALELIIVYSLLAAGWWMLRTMQRRGRLHPDPARDGLADVETPAGAGRWALATHAILMTAVVMILAQSEDKKQVLAAVGLGAFCGAFFPYWQQGVRPSAWYLAGPLAVGLAGYLWAFATAPASLSIARPGYDGGFLAALARPLPLDYASFGTAGALLGYWMRRKSLRDRDVAETAGAAAA